MMRTVERWFSKTTNRFVNTVTVKPMKQQCDKELYSYERNTDFDVDSDLWLIDRFDSSTCDNNVSDVLPGNNTRSKSLPRYDSSRTSRPLSALV